MAAAPQVHEEFYSTGNLAHRYETVNGKKHGVAERWLDNGRLRSRRTWVDGEPHVLECYYPDGSVSSRFDKFHEVYEKWHPNGQLANRQISKDGVLLLEHTWSEDGTPDMSRWFDSDPNNSS